MNVNSCIIDNSMIEENKNCWLLEECNHCDCDSFCMRRYKLNYLYDEALMTLKQRQRIQLRLDKDEADRESFTFLSAVERNILKFVETGDNIYIHSSVTGNGKTAWSLRLMQSFFNNIWIDTELKCRGLFIHVPRYLLELKNNLSEKSEYVQHIKENVLNADLVIWDEIGTKEFTQFEHENILNLINARIDLGKSNIYTSNLSAEELRDAVGDRLYSRIILCSNDVPFVGLDKRAIG